MEMNNEMISINLHLENFKQYLDVNNRCILSSRFGNGKSYFISKFIEKYSENYLFIPIYPVNYQVMDNKDIFELIKRDVLIRLLSNDLVEVDNINLNTPFLCYQFFKNNPADIISFIIDVIPNINLFGIDINIGNIIKKADSIKRKYETWKNKTTENDKDSSTNYIKSFESLKGSIYEFDAITQLICDIIKEYKNNHPEKEVVLIIEDLDRIDPAHIFRILNVFSAHFDRYSHDNIFEQNNKFGFDKIISVCDIENIKNIYSHIYGEKTDFLGYISKFSNSQPYKYSLIDFIKEYIINNLLDKELLKYSQICDIISEEIVKKMDLKEQVEANLRIIKERIINSNKFIKDKQIQLTKQLEGKYITTTSTFTYLLSLLRCFDIEFDTFIKRFPKEEIIPLVGKNWYLIGLFTKDIFFVINNNSIQINYIPVRRGKYYSDWVNYPYFNMRLNPGEKELFKFEISYSENRDNTLADMMFIHIDKIINLLEEKALI